MPQSHYLGITSSSLLRTVTLVGGFIFICALINQANAIMNEAEKDQIRTGLGDYFQNCMDAAKEVSFCLVSKYLQADSPSAHLNPGADSFDCSLSQQQTMQKHGVISSLFELCLRAMQPQGDVYQKTCYGENGPCIRHP